MAESEKLATCPVCACLCDDLVVRVAEGQIQSVRGSCPLSEAFYSTDSRATRDVAEIDGSPAPLNAALDRSAEILSSARAPLIYGLSRSETSGQRAAVSLADRLGASIDTTASLGHGTSVMAVQAVGESTCSLGEARNRADLAVFWGTNPARSHPRHFERYSVDPPGAFVPRGRLDRRILVIDPLPTETAAIADTAYRVRPGTDFELIWTLRLLIRGAEPEFWPDVGLNPTQIRELAHALTTCRYGIVYFGFGLSRNPQGHLVVEALLRLVTEINRHTRCCARRMRGSGDVTGADLVLGWQTGYPFAVNLARGYPRYNPGEFSANELLERGEVDVCLLVGSYGARRFSPDARRHLSRIPTIVLDPAHARCEVEPDVRFTTATPGLHIGGTAYRMDEVPVPLHALLPSPFPTDREILGQIESRLSGGVVSLMRNSSI